MLGALWKIVKTSQWPLSNLKHELLKVHNIYHKNLLKFSLESQRYLEFSFGVFFLSKGNFECKFLLFSGQYPHLLVFQDIANEDGTAREIPVCRDLPRTPKTTFFPILFLIFLSCTSTSLFLPFSSSALPGLVISSILPFSSVPLWCRPCRAVSVGVRAARTKWCLFSLHGAESTEASASNPSFALQGQGETNQRLCQSLVKISLPPCPSPFPFPRLSTRLGHLPASPCSSHTKTCGWSFALVTSVSHRHLFPSPSWAGQSRESTLYVPLCALFTYLFVCLWTGSWYMTLSGLECASKTK